MRSGLRLLAIASPLLLAGVLAACGTAQTALPAPAAALPGDLNGGNPDIAQAQAQIFAATNKFRQEQGRAALTQDVALQQTAQAFADYMARSDRYGHNADGRQPSDRAKAAGYAFCMVAENIGFARRNGGFATEELSRFFAEGWKNSPVHRRNMLRANADHMAIAVAKSPGTPKWFGVQLFGQPEARRAKFQVANVTGGVVDYSLNGKRQTLGANFTHTISRCAPLELQIAGLGNAASLTPVNGTRYEIARSGIGGKGALTVRLEQMR